MIKNPKVSIIVICFNAADHIEECIDSLLKSTYPNFEIIVVDNGSIDNTFDFLQKKYKKIKKVKIIRTPVNRFYAGGCNFGARGATGEKLVSFAIIL